MEVCYTVCQKSLTSFHITWLKLKCPLLYFNVSYHIFAHTHCNTRLVPLYLHTVLPQSNTLCPLQLISFKMFPKLFSLHVEYISQHVSLHTVHVILFYYLNHRYQNCVYTYRILPNEDKKLSVQVGWQFETCTVILVQSQMNYYSCRVVGVFAGYVKIKGCFSSNMRTSCCYTAIFNAACT